MLVTSSQVSRGKVIGQCLVILIMGIWSFQLLTRLHPFIFMDYSNLLIHETGHLVFSPFGQFIYFLGGSLFQCLVPFLVLLYFYYTKQYFAAGFSCFWLGDNLVYVATYMKDAIAMSLPLVGGDIHDWNWLFSHLGILQEGPIVGSIVFAVGTLCLISGISFCSFLTGREMYKNTEMI